MSTRIIVVGSGAREHALAYRLARNSHDQIEATRQVFVVGSNPRLMQEFECIKPRTSDVMGVVDVARRLSPDLVVVGPETYLEQGLVDALKAHGIAAFGPNKLAAQLEASKIFMKGMCQKARVATAAYKKFNEYSPAIDYLAHRISEKAVIKADGLCGGKGALVCHSKAESIAALDHLFNREGFANLQLKSHEIIIEDFLLGQEISVFGVTNGEDAVLFCPLQDYKRLQDSDQGPNTGGMGAIGPLGQDFEERKAFLARIKAQIFLPMLKSMRTEGFRFRGLLYAGLMKTPEGIKVLEFNVRFGDPETQSLMFGTKADIYPLLKAVTTNETIDFDFWQSQLLHMDYAVTVVLASEGYPTQPKPVQEVVQPAILPEDTNIFYGSNCGRVLSVVGRGPSIERAKTKVYDLVRQIKFVGRHHRLDIGSNQSPLT